MTKQNDENLCERCVELDNNPINPAKPYHECPYKIEVSDNYEKCNCCDECKQQCIWDI